MHLVVFELIAFSLYLFSGGVFFWIKYGTRAWGKLALGMFTVFITATGLAALVSLPISNEGYFQVLNRLGLSYSNNDLEARENTRCYFREEFTNEGRLELDLGQFFIPFQIPIACKLENQKPQVFVSKLHDSSIFSFREGDGILYLSTQAGSNSNERASSPATLEAALLKLGHKALYVGVLRNENEIEIGPAVPNILNILVNQESMP